ncbi:unnamed protein product [marine sediment metagenome]|uniref:Uncharacterized protein n=1 Tax=marine sediment metagenome TaxID=412755 RepID=X1IHC8_9ZZZZ
MNESDAFKMIQSLGNYLKTDMETSYGTIEKQVRHEYERKTIQSEGHTIKITVSNTAPVEPTWPLVVFTGVGLACREDIRSVFRAMQHENRLKVSSESTTKKDVDNDSLLLLGARRVDGKIFPSLTHDEFSHGYCLYSGQSIVYEMKVLLKECSDLKDMNILVEGTVSRRHLFHQVKELTP